MALYLLTEGFVRPPEMSLDWRLSKSRMHYIWLQKWAQSSSGEKSTAPSPSGGQKGLYELVVDYLTGNQIIYPWWVQNRYPEGRCSLWELTPYRVNLAHSFPHQIIQHINTFQQTVLIQWCSLYVCLTYFIGLRWFLLYFIGLRWFLLYFFGLRWWWLLF